MAARPDQRDGQGAGAKIGAIIGVTYRSCLPHTHEHDHTYLLETMTADDADIAAEVMLDVLRGLKIH